MDLTSLPPDKRKICEEILNGEEEAIYENITNKTLTTFLGENELFGKKEQAYDPYTDPEWDTWTTYTESVSSKTK